MFLLRKIQEKIVAEIAKERKKGGETKLERNWKFALIEQLPTVQEEKKWIKLERESEGGEETASKNQENY